ncbi:hypothetical protein D0499_05190 [Weissella soli]|uniref:hypothetical protein n=1 Tax=Weissella soli TaxID=155866 RepID=UPI0021BE1911|nr:hypothetical protein [Weissella soli]MCT8395206.1 hypothetical protein [Weissella soli]
MKQIRIEDQMTVAQIELEIAKAKKHDALPALVRFDPTKTALLKQNDIKFRKIDSNDYDGEKYDDLFRVYE